MDALRSLPLRGDKEEVGPNSARVQWSFMLRPGLPLSERRPINDGPEMRLVVTATWVRLAFSELKPTFVQVSPKPRLGRYHGWLLEGSTVLWWLCLPRLL